MKALIIVLLLTACAQSKQETSAQRIGTKDDRGESGERALSLHVPLQFWDITNEISFSQQEIAKINDAFQKNDFAKLDFLFTTEGKSPYVIMGDIWYTNNSFTNFIPFSHKGEVLVYTNKYGIALYNDEEILITKQDFGILNEEAERVGGYLARSYMGTTSLFILGGLPTETNIEAYLDAFEEIFKEDDAEIIGPYYTAPRSKQTDLYRDLRFSGTVSHDLPINWLDAYSNFAGNYIFSAYLRHFINILNNPNAITNKRSVMKSLLSRHNIPIFLINGSIAHDLLKISIPNSGSVRADLYVSNTLNINISSPQD